MEAWRGWGSSVGRAVPFACSLVVAVACARSETGGDSAAAPVSPAPPAAAAVAPPPPTVDLGAVVARLHDGIDVSVHSGAVDWSTVAASGHGFVVLKATEGVDLADAAFAEHWPAVKAAGLVRGAYHFYVTEDDPDEQADFFTRTVRLEPGDLAPVVDIELIGHGTTPGLAGRLRRFLSRLEAHYGIRPILYTDPDFWDQHLASASDAETFGSYPLWVAEYDVDSPRLPTDWSIWHLWQWRADAAVPGVENGADLNRAHAEADLRGLVVVQVSPS